MPPAAGAVVTAREHGKPCAPLLTARETAEIIGVSAETVLRYVRAGSLPAIRLPGGAVRVRSAELEAWLVTRRAVPATLVVTRPVTSRETA